MYIYQEVLNMYYERDIDTIFKKMNDEQKKELIDEIKVKVNEETVKQDEINSYFIDALIDQVTEDLVKEYGYDENIIYYAYEESIDRTGKMSMPYMDKIIRSWHEKGVKTVSDIQNERIKWETEKKKRFSKDKKKEDKPQGDASYDIDEYMKKSLNLQYVKNDAKSGV